MDQPAHKARRKHHIIYKTTCLVTGKWYIGMHSTNDLNDGYIGSGKRLWYSIKKYGKEQHRCEILEHLPDRETLALREEEILTPELKADPLCLNLAKGGLGHHPGWYTTSESTKAKLSAASKAVVHTKEWHEKIGKALKGKAKPRTEDGDATWREKVVGRKATDEQIQKLKVGQQNSEQFKKRYRPFTVDGAIYQNGREAVEALGIAGGTLTNRLLSPNWLNYQYLDAPKDPSAVSAKARGGYQCK
jgi:group I intron endonuclease